MFTLIAANVAVGAVRLLGIWEPLTDAERHFNKFRESCSKQPSDLEQCPQPAEKVSLRLRFTPQQFGDERKGRVMLVQTERDAAADVPAKRQAVVYDQTLTLVEIEKRPWSATINVVIDCTDGANVLPNGKEQYIDLRRFSGEEQYTFDERNRNTTNDEDDYSIDFEQYPKQPLRVGETWELSTSVPDEAPQEVRESPPACAVTLRRKVLLDGKEVFEITGKASYYFLEKDIPISVDVRFRYFIEADTGLQVWNNTTYRWDDTEYIYHFEMTDD